MKRFILKTSAFLSLLILFAGALISLLPPTPRAATSLLFAEPQKDSLLINTPAPRIIFVGGSNLSFGLNSQSIKDSFHVNPINTAISAALGIQYMLKNTMQYVKKGDLLVFVFEYEHFYRGWDRGTEELFRTVIDCNRRKIKLLNFKQLYNCFQYAGKILLSKTRISEYTVAEESDVYSVHSFNRYGDVDAHWNLENRHFEAFKTIDTTTYSREVMDGIKSVVDQLQGKGCIVLISYPCLQETAFINKREAIKKIEKEYRKFDFTVLGTPERYMMPDSLMFDSPYHTNKQGVERRTKLLIEDLTVIIDSLGILE